MSGIKRRHDEREEIGKKSYVKKSKKSLLDQLNEHQNVMDQIAS